MDLKIRLSKARGVFTRLKKICCSINKPEAKQNTQSYSGTSILSGPRQVSSEGRGIPSNGGWDGVC